MKKDMKTLLKKLFKYSYYQDIIVLLFCLDSYYERVYVKSQQSWELIYSNYGLSQKHIRYLLMKQHGLDRLCTSQMREFEKDNKIAVDWFKQGRLKNSIKSQKDLNHYLKQLKSKGVIKNISRKKPYRYILFDEFREAIELIKIEDHINAWGSNYTKIITPQSDDEGYIFGMPDDRVFTKEERYKIAEHLTIVHEKLQKIVDLANNKKTNLEDKSIGFFYYGKKK